MARPLTVRGGKPAATAPPKPPVPAKPQPRLVEQPPRVTEAKSGVGMFWDPINPGPNIPAPTWEQQGNPLDAALGGELERLQQAGLNADRGQFPTALGRVQEDLASQLANLQRQREWAAQDVRSQQEDLRRQQGEIRRQLPGALEDTRTGFSARGMEFGGRKTQAVGEVQRAADEDLAKAERGIAEGERAIARGEQEFVSRIEQANRDAARAKQDLERERAEFERKVKEGELKTAAQARAAATASQRSQATSWTQSRYYELVASGLSPEQARSRALSDGRSAYPGVGDTWLVGGLETKGLPKEQGAPKQTSIEKRYGVPISSDRAMKVQPKTREKARQEFPSYRDRLADVEAYLRQGGTASAEAITNYIDKRLIDSGKTASEAAAFIRQYGFAISTMLADLHITD